MSAQTSGIIRHFPSFPRTKKYGRHLGGALLAALLAAPAWACTDSLSNKTLPDYVPTMTVGSGGEACNTTIYKGGEQIVEVGGTATGTTLSINLSSVLGGKQVVHGTATGTTIYNFGEQYVKNGGTATGTTIYGGGEQFVEAGGKATDTTIGTNGAQTVRAGGEATGTTINGNGYQEVYGTAIGTNVTSTQYVHPGGTASNTTIDDGLQYIYDGGTATDTVMKYGALRVDTNSGKLLGTLEVHGTGNIAKLPDRFDFPSLKFVLPAGMGAGGPMLNISASVYGDPAPEIALTDVDISVQTTALNVGDEITLISGAKGITGFSSPTTLNRDGYTFEVREEGGSLIAKVTVVTLYSVSIDPGISGGSITGCNPLTVEHGTTLSISCTATPDTNAGYSFTSLTLTDTTGRTATCNATTCDLTDVRGDVTVSATFTKVPPQPQQPQPQQPSDNGGGAPQPQQPYVISSTPTMGELGLLLSGFALAGAAVPALRRREKQGKKTDTRQ